MGISADSQSNQIPASGLPNSVIINGNTEVNHEEALVILKKLMNPQSIENSTDHLKYMRDLRMALTQQEFEEIYHMFIQKGGI